MHPERIGDRHPIIVVPAMQLQSPPGGKIVSFPDLRASSQLHPTAFYFVRPSAPLLDAMEDVHRLTMSDVAGPFSRLTERATASLGVWRGLIRRVYS